MRQLFVYVYGCRLESISFVSCQPHLQISMSSSTQPQAASASPMPEGVTDPNYKPLPGRLGNLTVQQMHTLEKFKKELQDEGQFVPERMDDATLLRYVLATLFYKRPIGEREIHIVTAASADRSSLARFLRARRFDLAKAKAMLLAAEEWRKKEKVEEIAK
jgi:CRAL/TRIO, N-terminal domain